MKRTLKIIAITLCILLLGLVYYYFFFAKKNNSAGGNTGIVSTITNFFPFGNNSPTITTGGGIATSTSTTPLSQTGNYLQKLRLISNEPVAGATFVSTTSGTLIRYMEKATGHIYDVSTYSELALESSNTTIPKIHEAFFTEGGTGLIARYIDDDGETIKTIYGKISSTTIVTALPDNITFISAAPSGKNIFYINSTQNGSTGILSAPNGSGKKQIWKSPISHFIPQFINDTQALVTTNPHADAPGNSYLINTKTAAAKSVLSQISDLSALSNPTGTSLLGYSSFNNGTLFTYVISKATTIQITPTTFPEKCVFDPNSKNQTIVYCAVPRTTLDKDSLDNWYLGLVSYSDDIWKYDLASNTSTLIEDLSVNAGRNIDGINLHINTTGSLITFENKTDGSLWSLNVSDRDSTQPTETTR